MQILKSLSWLKNSEIAENQSCAVDSSFSIFLENLESTKKESNSINVGSFEKVVSTLNTIKDNCPIELESKIAEEKMSPILLSPRLSNWKKSIN